MTMVAAAALAGLLATPHCAAMCGGFAGACARPRAGLWAWHGGRLLTYATLGAAAGAFGGVLPGPRWLSAVLSALLLTWFAAALAGLVVQPSLRVPGLARAGSVLARRNDVGSRLLFGAVTGVLPCGMVYAALGLAVAAAGPAAGAAAMLAFGAATVPGLSVLAVGVQRLALRGIGTRRVLAALILVLGLWSVGMRSFAGGAHAHGGDHGVSAAPGEAAVHAPGSGRVGTPAGHGETAEVHGH